jgi:hypothetical protein
LAAGAANAAILPQRAPALVLRSNQPNESRLDLLREAHLSRDIKQFTGETPRALLGPKAFQEGLDLQERELSHAR